jgi:pyrroloquinoline quinone biosynthesis protein E
MTIDRPLSLIAELTYRCPLRCPYCSNPLNFRDPSYRQELTTHQWLEVIRQGAKLGILQLGFTGGEPLLRADLETLVEAAAETGLYTSLITAGNLLSEERAEALQACGLDHVQISVQDNQATASDAMAGARSFEQKMAAARWVKKIGFPLTINVVLHRQNLDHIEEIIDLCASLQADRVELANTQYYGWALRNRASLLPTRAQLQRAQDVVTNAQQHRRFPMGLVYVLPDYYTQYPKPCMGGWGQKTMVVTPHGEVLPCQVAKSIPDLTFANARHQTLAWIWFESEAFNRFRGAHWMEEPCRSCPRKTIDFGGCRCQALLLTGNAKATDPACHLSPHHHIVVAAQDQTNTQTPPSLVYRSVQKPP